MSVAIQCMLIYPAYVLQTHLIRNLVQKPIIELGWTTHSRLTWSGGMHSYKHGMVCLFMVTRAQNSGPALVYWCSRLIWLWGLWNNNWFQCRCSHVFKTERIPQQELLPIVMACMLWEHQWWGQYICCHCDNAAVVQVLNSDYNTDKQMMRLICYLFFCHDPLAAIGVSSTHSGEYECCRRCHFIG